MKVKVLVPESTSPAKVAQARAYGAEIVLVPGPREATETAAMELASETFYASHNWHPFFFLAKRAFTPMFSVHSLN